MARLHDSEERVWDHLCRVTFRAASHPSEMAQAIAAVVGIRLGLALLPFSRLSHLLTKLEGMATSQQSQTALSPELLWAVRGVSRKLIGRNACLTRALAVRLLAARRGIDAQVKVGFARGDDGQLKGHAWVEQDGDLLIGGPAAALERYTLLRDWTELEKCI